MLVVIGSKNKSKIDGVKRAYEKFLRGVSVTGVDVTADLPPQPVGLEKIFEGALKRALKALEVLREADHGVGVEAGLFKMGGKWFDVHVVSIADRNRWITYGLSPAFEVPDIFIKKILDGEVIELEVIVDTYFKTRNIGEYGGFIKILTRGEVIRDDLVFYATLMALTPRINEELYHSI